VHLFRKGEAEVVEGARLHHASLKRPAYDPDSYPDHLESLELNQMEHFAGPRRVHLRQRTRLPAAEALPSWAMNGSAKAVV